MVSRFPYQLYVFRENESTQSSKGDWIQSPGAWEPYSICRHDDAKGKSIKGEDGSVIAASLVVYMPSGKPVVASGKKIKITSRSDESVELMSGRVLFSVSTLLNTKIWV